ncbi:MAG: serine--tRNA ligase [Planctomycetes bacterium]|nr:serine--tRNA ligase [Planctomycetota bacterium]
MLDLDTIRTRTDEVRANIANRRMAADVDAVLRLADERSALIQQLDNQRARRKDLSKQIHKASETERPALVEESGALKATVAEAEARLTQTEAQLREEQARIPNLTHPDSPIGPDESHNRELRRWGEVPTFDFKPLDHVAIGEALGLLDFDSATKVTGSNFYFLKNEAVLLELALMRFALERLRDEGFTLYATPDMARMKVFEGTGFNPRGEETQVYRLEGEDLGLIATAEITLGGLLMDEILDAARLPLKLGGVSHCFRREAGAYGRAGRGLYRVHQFTKVEMFAFTRPEDSDAMHLEMLRIEEDIYQRLGIPYRVVDICTGDLGGPAYRKFDLEAWMPGRGEGGAWGEITSTSNCTDYQARRLAIRFRRAAGQKPELVHTLNGTAIALSRTLLAVLENGQQSDGSVAVPAVLRPLTGFDRIGPAGCGDPR